MSRLLDPIRWLIAILLSMSLTAGGYRACPSAGGRVHVAAARSCCASRGCKADQTPCHCGRACCCGQTQPQDRSPAKPSNNKSPEGPKFVCKSGHAPSGADAVRVAVFGRSSQGLIASFPLLTLQRQHVRLQV